MSTSIDVGLVFAIPLAENMFGFGQLIAREHPVFYMIGYSILAELPRLSRPELEKAKPVLIGNFFDVLIRKHRWESIGDFPCPKVPFPCFKIKIGDSFYVESWDRKRKRKATPEDIAILQPRTNYGPIVLENALKAHHGLIPWEDMFDPLKAENVNIVSDLC